MISVQRNHVLETCEFDHVRFANRSQVGRRTNRLKETAPSHLKSRPRNSSEREYGSGVVLCKGAKLQAESR